MNTHEKINYVEFPSRDLDATEAFFNQVFGWQFTDYGPDYTAFSDQGLDGGFYRSDVNSTSESGGALIVFYSEQLEQTRTRIEAAGGRISKPIFSFPGGRRFHFIEPGGNELAVWSDRGAD
jgi:predicted enzyme related to lactoylglutathione lyase